MNKAWLVVLAPALVFLAPGLPAGAEGKEDDAAKNTAAAEPGGASDKAIEGLWSGPWGGGQRNGVVLQPMTAELWIKGNHVEMYGFPNVGRLTGTIRSDAAARQIRIFPTAEADGQPTPKATGYAYQVKADELTLTDSNKFSISLQKCCVTQDPPANAEVHLVSATGINDAGDLLVTEFSELRVGRAGTTSFQPSPRSLKTKQATVLLIHETGWKKIAVDEARTIIRKPTPVVVAYRHDDRPSPHQLHQLWKDMGPPGPDNHAVWQTFSRLLRPGTLVFVLSARENSIQP